MAHTIEAHQFAARDFIGGDAALDFINTWVFIDSSKAGRRRWCDMAVYGNVAKAERFYARTRKKVRG